MPDHLQDFETATLDYHNSLQTHDQKLLALQIADHTWRVQSRQKYGLAFVTLLFLQNVAVFTLIYIAYWQGRLSDLTLIFATLTTATLIETAYTINIVIRWLFRDIRYSLQGKDL